jgi:hypothetical protein
LLKFNDMRDGQLAKLPFDGNRYRMALLAPSYTPTFLDETFVLSGACR